MLPVSTINSGYTHLDGELFLLDADGRSQLAYSDDGGAGPDPYLTFQLPRSGVYYLKLRAFHHPGRGDSTNNYRYTLRLDRDNTPPSLTLLSPVSNMHLGNSMVVVQAEASDAQSGLSKVEFLYHNGEWWQAAWTALPAPSLVGGVWQTTFDPASYSETRQAALAVRVTDAAGNRVTRAVWNLTIDHTAPQTTLLMAGEPISSTLIPLYWEGSDAFSSMITYTLLYEQDGGPINLYAFDKPQVEDWGGWWVAEPGHTYTLRLQGTDAAGNVEMLKATPEITLTVPGALALCGPMLETTPDNDPANAQPYQPGVQRSFCNPLTADLTGDEDWISYTVQAGQLYLLRASPLQSKQFMPGWASAPEIYVYLAAEPLGDPLAYDSSGKFGASAVILWRAPADGVALLRVRHQWPQVIGADTAYEVHIAPVQVVYAPYLAR